MITATKTLRVGIIGASAERGWAKDSHVPAVQGLAGLELVAVASGSQEKSDAAARAFSAKKSFGDAKELACDPDVDVVAVAVKVPDHRELVLTAIAAGKHVYCEWPLGCNVAETLEMAGAARAVGVHTAIGLQTRANPAAWRAREIIATGGIGRVLSARVLSTTMAFGPKVEAAMLFAEKAENGVTLVTIQGAHTLDLTAALLGPFADLAALTTIQYPELEIDGEAKPQARSIPDHLLAIARLSDGGVLSVEVAGGRPPDATPFCLEVTGEKGVLNLDGGAARGFQSGRLRLSLNGESQTVNEGEVSGMPAAAANVAGIYATLRDDIFNGTSNVPGFDHAVLLARLVDDLLAAAKTGTRQPVKDWPRE